MPSLADLEAAVPTCPRKLGTVPQLQRACGKPLRSIPMITVDVATNRVTEVSGRWACPVHGSVLSWTDAGRRAQEITGGMWFTGEAA